MKFTKSSTTDSSLSGDGDKAALDVWAYGSTAAVTSITPVLKLVDTSFKATVAGDSPASVTLTLKDNTGNVVTADASGNAL